MEKTNDDLHDTWMEAHVSACDLLERLENIINHTPSENDTLNWRHVQTLVSLNDQIWAIVRQFEEYEN